MKNSTKYDKWLKQLREIYYQFTTVVQCVFVVESEAFEKSPALGCYFFTTLGRPCENHAKFPLSRVSRLVLKSALLLCFNDYLCAN